MREWVNEKLYPEAKMIYDRKVELRVGRDIYWKFLMDCKHKLLGLKGLPGERNKQLRKTYVNMLWTEANKPRSDTVTGCISDRRGTSYQQMFNKFKGG
jgi:hypothetical protein